MLPILELYFNKQICQNITSSISSQNQLCSVLKLQRILQNILHLCLQCSTCREKQTNKLCKLISSSGNLFLFTMLNIYYYYKSNIGLYKLVFLIKTY